MKKNQESTDRGQTVQEYLDKNSKPCATCKGKTQMTTECTNCWEVERRLRTYLQSANGLAFVIEELVQRVVQDESNRVVAKAIRSDARKGILAVLDRAAVKSRKARGA